MTLNLVSGLGMGPESESIKPEAKREVVGGLYEKWIEKCNDC